MTCPLLRYLKLDINNDSKTDCNSEEHTGNVKFSGKYEYSLDSGAKGTKHLSLTLTEELSQVAGLDSAGQCETG